MFQGSATCRRRRTSRTSRRRAARSTARPGSTAPTTSRRCPRTTSSSALWLESDRMGWLLPAMTQEKLDNQRDVVKNERRWRVDNQPYGDWDERLQALMYPPEHPYHHSVIGSMADLDAASLEDVEQFFRTYYAPNNAVLTICGDFDRAREARSSSGISAASRAARDSAAARADRAAADARVRRTRRPCDQEISLPRMYVAYRIPPYGDGRASTRRGRRARSSAPEGVAAVSHADPRAAHRAGRRRIRVPHRRRCERCWCSGRRRSRTGFRRARSGADARGRCARTNVEHGDVERAVRTDRGAPAARTCRRVGERADQLSMFATLFDDPGRINTESTGYRAVTTADVRAFAARTCVPTTSSRSMTLARSLSDDAAVAA